MSLRLYEISNQYQQLFSHIEKQESIDSTMLAELEEVKDLMEDKAIALASYIKNIEAEEMAIDEAIDRMEERKQKLVKKMDALYDYLSFNMKRCGITEIKRSPYFTIKFRNLPPKVNITNESLISDEYKKTKEVVTIDKEKIKEHLKEGVVIEGAELQTDNVKLEIK